jgi:hypothetical protein
MNVHPLLRHYLRIDPRSLGLFRLAFGATLLADLAYRFEHRVAFYSNEGVLPNHNHLFNLKNEGRFVWSMLHAFASTGEATVGLLLIGFVFSCFFLGFKTRVFHVLSIVGLISLSARNLLTVGPGEPVALALLVATAFLPLGSSFSLDALRARAATVPEQKPKELLVADPPGGRETGFSPVSLAAVLVLVVVVLVLATTAKGRTGAWLDGTALERAMNLHLVASPLGRSLRGSFVLSLLTRLVAVAHYAVPALLLMPVLRSPARLAASAILVSGSPGTRSSRCRVTRSRARASCSSPPTRGSAGRPNARLHKLGRSSSIATAGSASGSRATSTTWIRAGCSCSRATTASGRTTRSSSPAATTVPPSSRGASPTV